MATKLILTPFFIGLLTLAGCGDHDKQAAHDAQDSEVLASKPASPEMTTVVSEDGIEPIGSDILATAKRTGDTCSLDSIDGNYSKDQVKLVKGQPHVFRGWLLDEAKQPAGQFSLVLKGSPSFAITASTGVTRADVGEFFKDPALSHAGFNISSTLAPVQTGRYHVIYLTKSSGQAYFCDTGKMLTVE